MKAISIPVTVVVLAMCAPAHADLLSRLDHAFRQDAVLEAPALTEFDAARETVIVDEADAGGAPLVDADAYAGYPFISRCAEPRSSCCTHLWDGYCGQMHCGHRLRHLLHRRAPDHGHCCDGHLKWPTLNLQKWFPCEAKCDSCGPKCHKPFWGLRGHGCHAKSDPCGCGPKFKLGLFDWLRHGCHGHPAGCGCAAGYYGPQIMESGEAVPALEAAPEPPMPTPTSTNSARRGLWPQGLQLFSIGFEF